MKSPAYILGFLCGLLAVAVVTILLRLVFKRKIGVCGNEYDERQRAIQGTGYKYAFFTLLIGMGACSVVDETFNIPWLTVFPMFMLCMWISLCVFVTYCVWRDAYFSLRSHRKSWIAVFLVAGIVNLGIAIGESIANGGIPLDNVFANLVTGVCAPLLALVTIAKGIYDRRQVESE